jgi:hypothetical protein
MRDGSAPFTDSSRLVDIHQWEAKAARRTPAGSSPGETAESESSNDSILVIKGLSVSGRTAEMPMAL